MPKVEVDQWDLEEITRQIKEGFTSGRLDNEDGRRHYWELKINSWKEEG